MNFQLSAINEHLPGDLSNIALGFLRANTICSRPLACGICHTNQAEFLGGRWNGMFHCYECRKVQIGKEPIKNPHHAPIRLVLFEDVLAGTVEQLGDLVCVHQRFPTPAISRTEERHGFPTHFVYCDDLYWGPAAPGFR